MSDTLTLWCFIEGDRRAFSVEIGGQATIDKLSEQVHAKRLDLHHQGISAANLLLYKVCNFLLYQLHVLTISITII